VAGRSHRAGQALGRQGSEKGEPGDAGHDADEEARHQRLAAGLRPGVGRGGYSLRSGADTNPRYSNRSYTIFNVPAMKKGRLTSDGRANIHPANTGAMAAPVVRATPVIPAAADRSSGRTTAIT